MGGLAAVISNFWSGIHFWPEYRALENIAIDNGIIFADFDDVIKNNGDILERIIETEGGIGISGGDGTERKIIQVFIEMYEEKYPDKPFPRFLIMPQGTNNALSTSLGVSSGLTDIIPQLRRQKMRNDNFLSCIVLQKFLEYAETHEHIPTKKVNLMKVNDKYGFIFGIGAVVNFLFNYYNIDLSIEELKKYQRKDGFFDINEMRKASGFSVAMSIFKTSWSFVHPQGKYGKKLYRPIEADVYVDGQKFDMSSLEMPGKYAIFSATHPNITSFARLFDKTQIDEKDPENLTMHLFIAGLKPRKFLPQLYTLLIKKQPMIVASDDYNALAKELVIDCEQEFLGQLEWEFFLCEKNTKITVPRQVEVYHTGELFRETIIPSAGQTTDYPHRHQIV